MASLLDKTKDNFKFYLKALGIITFCMIIINASFPQWSYILNHFFQNVYIVVLDWFTLFIQTLTSYDNINSVFIIAGAIYIVGVIIQIIGIGGEKLF